MGREPPPYALDDDALLASCRIESFGAAGPGGQHRNRTASGVRLTHPPSGAAATCQDHRERRRNERDALRRLRIRLACTLRGGSDPAWLAAQRRGARLPVGAGAASYPLVAAVLLDALAEHAGSPAAAARAHALSTSQAVRALCADKEVRAAADAIRAAHGRPPLRQR